MWPRMIDGTSWRAPAAAALPPRSTAPHLRQTPWPTVALSPHRCTSTSAMLSTRTGRSCGELSPFNANIFQALNARSGVGWLAAAAHRSDRHPCPRCSDCGCNNVAGRGSKSWPQRSSTPRPSRSSSPTVLAARCARRAPPCQLTDSRHSRQLSSRLPAAAGPPAGG